VIGAALGREMEALDLTPAQLARRPRPRTGCIVRAMLALQRAQDKVAAVHLAVASGLERPQVVIAAARMMTELRAHASARAFMAGLEADPDLPLLVRRNFLDLRIHSRLGLRPSDHAIFVPGPVPDSLAAALATMPRPGIEWTHPVMAAAIVARRGLSGAAAAEFRRGLDWGRAVQDYLTFLMFYTAPDGGPPADAGGADNAAIHALAGQIRDLVVLPEPNPLVAAAATGRGLVLTSAHTGLPLLAPRIMRPAGLPLFGISAQAPTDLTSTFAKTLGAHGNFHNDFLKAVKLLRREPHLCQLMPDGGVGEGLVEKPFMGSILRLGPGAAVIAWQTRAAVFFFSTRWQDGKLHIYVRTGPVAEKGGDRAAFETAFYDFYLGCLEEVVMGAPENMTPGNGFWPALVTEEIKAAFRPPAAAPGA